MLLQHPEETSQAIERFFPRSLPECLTQQIGRAAPPLSFALGSKALI